LPASYITIEQIRHRNVTPEEAVDLAERHASQIRQTLGWAREAIDRQELASRQCQESRRDRLAHLDQPIDGYKCAIDS
jgi:hypothetical protein